ncbi:MAG: type IV pilus twitching motility protein PilT [Opitutales bacterium]
MSQTLSYDPDAPVYPAGEHTLSINELLESAVHEDYMANGLPRISDFHFKVGHPVRFRLDDELETVPDGAALDAEMIEKLVFALLTPDQVNLLRSDPMVDVDAGYELPNGQFNFRLNIFRDRDGPAAVIRLLTPSVPSPNELGFPSDEIWQDMVHAKQGLVLLTGITGSGKSTTIASLLNEINRTRQVRVITLEDPVEFVFRSEAALISQREVGTHARSFSAGLTSILRENPDVIYVGEMRAPETAGLALTAAETGHLVFSTLHTRNCVGAITRILDMFPPERSKELATQLSFSLSYVVGQKLVPLRDGPGRCVAMEVLRNVTGLGNLIRTGNWHQIYSMMETRNRDGMITMEQSLIELHRRGLISRDEAIIHANDEAIIDRLPLEN